MKRLIKTTQLCGNVARKGYGALDEFDFSNAGFVTDGTPSQFTHSRLGWGYGFMDIETLAYKDKVMKDYESSQPWYLDYVDICEHLNVKDVLYIANVLTESWYYNINIINAFKNHPFLNFIGTEVGNEPWQSDFKMSFEDWRQRTTLYYSHTNSPVATPIVAQHDKAGYRSSMAFHASQQMFPKVALHRYFNPHLLMAQLEAYENEINELKQSLPENTKIWVTETNIHKDFIPGVSNDTLWDCWVEIKNMFERVGVEYCGFLNLYSHDEYHLIHPKNGPQIKSDGTAMVEFFL